MNKNRIKMFIDMAKSIDGLPHASIKDKWAFAESLKKLETTYNAKCDITFMTSFYDDKAIECMKQVAEVLQEQNFDGRISSCCSIESFTRLGAEPKPYEQEDFDYGGPFKLKLLQMYADKHEQNPEDILFLVFAGDDRREDYGMFEMQAVDEDQYLRHNENNEIKAYPHSTPSVFIDTNKKQCGYKWAHDGKIYGQSLDVMETIGNYNALTEGFKCVANNDRLKNILQTADVGKLSCVKASATDKDTITTIDG